MFFMLGSWTIVRKAHFIFSHCGSVQKELEERPRRLLKAQFGPIQFVLIDLVSPKNDIVIFN